MTYPFPNFNNADVHYIDVIMSTMPSQITGLTIIYPTVKSKKTSKFSVTSLCAGTSPATGEFPAQRTSHAENFPFDDVIMWRLGMDKQFHSTPYWACDYLSMLG